MSHKVLINGTAYAVAGGDALTGGTKYQIGGGRTLIDGTAYDISFGPNEHTITVTGGDASAVSISKKNAAYVLFGGKNYAEGTIKVPQGQAVIISMQTSRMMSGNLFITLNGAEIARSPSSNSSAFTYTYIPTEDATIAFAGVAGFGAKIWHADITTT